MPTAAPSKPSKSTPIIEQRLPAPSTGPGDPRSPLSPEAAALFANESIANCQAIADEMLLRQIEVGDVQQDDVGPWFTRAYSARDAVRRETARLTEVAKHRRAAGSSADFQMVAEADRRAREEFTRIECEQREIINAAQRLIDQARAEAGRHAAKLEAMTQARSALLGETLKADFMRLRISMEQRKWSESAEGAQFRELCSEREGLVARLSIPGDRRVEWCVQSNRRELLMRAHIGTFGNAIDERGWLNLMAETKQRLQAIDSQLPPLKKLHDEHLTRVLAIERHYWPA
jgi:hypothetical protein